MQFCIRYVDENPVHKIILREDFLKFVPVESTTGKNLANDILETLNSLGINLHCHFSRHLCALQCPFIKFSPLSFV